MTTEFITNCTKSDMLFDAIFSLMILGKTPEGTEPYNASKPLLTQIDNYINYYLNKNDGEHCQIPLFISYSTTPIFRDLLIEYLVIRLGVMCPSAIDAFKEEENRSLSIGRKMGLNRPVYIEPIVDDSEYSKKYYKKIKFHARSSDKSGKMIYGAASRLFKKTAIALSKNVCFGPTSSENMIICRNQELPSSRDTLLKDYYSESITDRGTVLCNTEWGGKAFFKALDDNKVEFDKDNPTHVNLYLLYSNTEQADFFQSDIELLEQIGYKIDNLFVFVLHSRPFCMSNLNRDRIKFQSKYTKDIFFLNSEETAYLCNLPLPKLNQLIVGEDDDYNIYGLEIQNILDGVFCRYNMRNIIGLCATDGFEDFFFEYLQKENPDYDLPESTDVFKYMRLQWEGKIIPAINDFAKDYRVAFVVDWKTPAAIRDEIASLFPDKKIRFYSLQNLKTRKDACNSIPERHIVLLRYTGFKENDIVFPNSYEPLPLREKQSLLEIIPMALFASNVAHTENNLIKYFNRVMQNGYRQDCLGWKKANVKSLVKYAIECDEDDDYRTPDRDAPRVAITYKTGKVSYQNESTRVVYKKGDVIAAGRLSEIIDDTAVSGIQFIDEIENHLEILVNKSEHKDSDLEKAQRLNYEQSYGIDHNPNIEIWRLLLMKVVKSKGKDIVYEDLINRIEMYEKKPKEIIDRWLNFRTTNLILPRKKKTKNIVFEYLGIPVTSPYRGVVYRKKMRAIQSSMEKNHLLDQIIFGVVNAQIDSGSFNSIYAQIPDALDLLDVTNDADLDVIRQEILNSIHLTEINNITSYGE